MTASSYLINLKQLGFLQLFALTYMKVLVISKLKDSSAGASARSESIQTQLAIWDIAILVIQASKMSRHPK